MKRLFPLAPPPLLKDYGQQWLTLAKVGSRMVTVRGFWSWGVDGDGIFRVCGVLGEFSIWLQTNIHLLPSCLSFEGPRKGNRTASLAEVCTGLVGVSI